MQFSINAVYFAIFCCIECDLCIALYVGYVLLIDCSYWEEFYDCGEIFISRWHNFSSVECFYQQNFFCPWKKFLSFQNLWFIVFYQLFMYREIFLLVFSCSLPPPRKKLNVGHMTKTRQLLLLVAALSQTDDRQTNAFQEPASG